MGPPVGVYRELIQQRRN